VGQEGARGVGFSKSVIARVRQPFKTNISGGRGPERSEGRRSNPDTKPKQNATPHKFTIGTTFSGLRKLLSGELNVAEIDSPVPPSIGSSEGRRAGKPGNDKMSSEDDGYTNELLAAVGIGWLLHPWQGLRYLWNKRSGPRLTMEGVRAKAWVPPEMFPSDALGNSGEINRHLTLRAALNSFLSRDQADTEIIALEEAMKERGFYFKLIDMRPNRITISATNRGYVVTLRPIQIFDSYGFPLSERKGELNGYSVRYYYDADARFLGTRVLRRSYDISSGASTSLQEVLRHEQYGKGSIPLYLTDGRVRTYINNNQKLWQDLLERYGLEGTVQQIRALENIVQRWRDLPRYIQQRWASMSVRGKDRRTTELMPDKDFVEAVLRRAWDRASVLDAISHETSFITPRIPDDILDVKVRDFTEWAVDRGIEEVDVRRFFIEVLERFDTLPVEEQARITGNSVRDLIRARKATIHRTMGGESLRAEMYFPPVEWQQAELFKLRDAAWAEKATDGEPRPLSPIELDLREALSEELSRVSELQADEFCRRIVARWEALSTTERYHIRIGLEDREGGGLSLSRKWAREQFDLMLSGGEFAEGGYVSLAGRPREDRDRAERPKAERGREGAADALAEGVKGAADSARRGRK